MGFNEKNITKKSDLENNQSISCYLEYGAQQNHYAYKVFYEFLENVKPKRILEIGTGLGGLTMALKLFTDEFGNDTVIRTYDINRPETIEFLNENGIDARLENIFKNDGTIDLEVVDFIQQDGVTVVLCDGGNKILEFNILSEHIKFNDFILAHDYARDLEYFRTYIDHKLWNWHEIHDSDIQEVVIKHNLKPYMAEEFQKAVWVCKIKE